MSRPGYVALEVSSDGEFLGASEVKFTGERKLADLQVGKSVKFAVPVLKPQGVDRHTGKIAAAKAETIDLGVDGKPTGLRPIDPQRDIPAGKLSVPASMAFEFVGDWSLTLLATRYELEDVKRTSIDRAFVRMVMTRGKDFRSSVVPDPIAKQRIAIKLPGAKRPRSAIAQGQQPTGVAGNRHVVSISSLSSATRLKRMCSSNCDTRSITDQHPGVCRNFPMTPRCSRSIWPSTCRRTTAARGAWRVDGGRPLGL